MTPDRIKEIRAVAQICGAPLLGECITEIERLQARLSILQQDYVSTVLEKKILEDTFKSTLAMSTSNSERKEKFWKAVHNYRKQANNFQSFNCAMKWVAKELGLE